MALGPLPDVDHVARVKMNGTNNGTPWVALFFWHYLTNAPDSSGMSALAAGFGAAWQSHLLPAFGVTVSLSNVEAWDLSRRDGPVGAFTAGFTGSRAGGPLPTSVSAVVSWKVNYRWRGGHFRTYWPAGTQTDVTAGHLWTDAAALAFEQGNSAFLAGVNAVTMNGSGGYLTGVRYVTTAGTPPTEQYLNPPLDLRIQDVLVDKRLDTQRRRLGPDL